MPINISVIALFKTLTIKKLFRFWLCLALSVVSYNSVGQTNEGLKALLDEVQNSIATDTKTDSDRLRAFTKNQRDQARLLKEAQDRLKKAELMQTFLKDRFDQNEDFIAEKNERLITRSGQLGEVFGVVKQQAQDFSGILQDSLTSIEFPNRISALEFADQKRIPTLNELKTLWFLLQQEMTASADIKVIRGNITLTNGQHKESEILRIGAFGAITPQGEYLQYLPNDQRMRVLPRQPALSIQRQAADFFAGQGESLVIDPSRGNLLELLGRTPTLKERVQQGGLVGYIIIGLGMLGALAALWRLTATLIAGTSVNKQLRQIEQPSSNNPLGRILLAASATNPNTSDAGQPPQDTQNEREIRIDEALLKEAPKLERGLTLLKLIAAIAPLLGLLGTVTGMIGTFQSITLFGTGDPKMMAGGISQALMTTVLGLCVAIPLLFSHSFISAKTRTLLQLLQQKSLALTIDRNSAINKNADIRLDNRSAGLSDAA
ncbi:MotA/TolQ/ExbB proton channel family protein [Alkalimarinus coralli]|uniref:MotA/TolQ/ExbB proton channel family protein n=1 Tax=Alkalimarinus coralli TaxID=2935863 RepID=UPI00202B1CB9|nr:MotA/TolQ/ExbB proton channel family protein [Alkalimarinus coralli]